MGVLWSLRILIFISITNVYSKSLTKEQIDVVEKLIQHYEIIEVHIAFSTSASKDFIDGYVDDILNLRSVAFNIHTNSTRNPLMFRPFWRHGYEALIMLFDDDKSLSDLVAWMELIPLHSSKLVVIITADKHKTAHRYYGFTLIYSNLLFIVEEFMVKYNIAAWKLEDITSADRFIALDPQHSPGDYLPRIELQIYEVERSAYPLLIELPSGRRTGIYHFITEAFEDSIQKSLARRLTQEELNDRIEAFFDVGVRHYRGPSTFPFKIVKRCIMLPIMDEIDEDEFLKKPFKDPVWGSVIVCLVYLTVMLRLLVIPDLFICFFEGLTTTLGSVYKGINMDSNRMRLVYLQLFLYGFIIWNLYNAKLSSYLVTPNLGRELETVDDIKKANLSVWGIIPGGQEKNSEFIKKLFPTIYEYKYNILKGSFDVNISTDWFYEHLMGFDTTYGYLVWEYMWSFLSRSQTLLEKKKFSFSELCTSTEILDPVDIPGDSAYLQNLISYFYMRVMESGLDYIWEQFTYYDIKFKFIHEESLGYKILGLKYFVYIWIAWVAGILLSIPVFCFEIYYFRVF